LWLEKNASFLLEGLHQTEFGPKLKEIYQQMTTVSRMALLVGPSGCGNIHLDLIPLSIV
jgi:hypothetical protein